MGLLVWVSHSFAMIWILQRYSQCQGMYSATGWNSLQRLFSHSWLFHEFFSVPQEFYQAKPGREAMNPFSSWIALHSSIEFNVYWIITFTVEKVDFHATGKSIYLACCRSLDVVPASYFIRHINDSSLQMAHHGVGVLGAKAMAIPLVVSTHTTS